LRRGPRLAVRVPRQQYEAFTRRQTFTLMRLPGVSEEKFHEDALWVERDLLRLKQLLEDTQ
jgi:hypothetical protein